MLSAVSLIYQRRIVVITKKTGWPFSIIGSYDDQVTSLATARATQPYLFTPLLIYLPPSASFVLFSRPLLSLFSSQSRISLRHTAVKESWYEGDDDTQARYRERHDFDEVGGRYKDFFDESELNERGFQRFARLILQVCRRRPAVRSCAS